MKILIVTSSMDDGGVARIVSDLTLLLPSEWEFDILLTHSADIRYEYKGRIISLEGIKEPKDRTNLVYVFKVFIKRFMTLRRLKHYGHYDICLSFMDTGNAVNVLTGNKYCKTMLAVENYMSLVAEYSNKYKYIVNPVIKALYNKADMVLPCSKESMKDLEINYGISPKRMEHIYCSVDIKDIEKTISEAVLPEEDSKWFSTDNTIITAGRLTLQKGQWHLIRAFSEVIKKVPEAKLVIFGEGELENYLRELISLYNLDNSVLIHTYTDILPKYISSSAFFVMPSLFEGFPTALLMALACGVPCVASDFVSGAREQLAPDYNGEVCGFYEGEYGVLSPKLGRDRLRDDTQLTPEEKGLAEAIILMLNNPDKREYYSKQAKKRIKSFDSKVICNQWRDSMIRLAGEK